MMGPLLEMHPSEMRQTWKRPLEPFHEPLQPQQTFTTTYKLLARNDLEI
uniref:Uncharacterized protein n=1 Tax=Rhizophora mucronata TaxID=61149 RepID=A0A2P2NCK7_RHIMU